MWHSMKVTAHHIVPHNSYQKETHGSVEKKSKKL